MKNTYILLITQALLTLLMFFSEGYIRYATFALFLLIDLALFVDLLTKRWSFDELLTLAAIFCSGIFVLFYIFNRSITTIIFGVVLVLLFLVIAMLNLISRAAVPKGPGDNERLQMPQEPEPYYDAEYDRVVYGSQNDYEKSVSYDAGRPARSPEPVMHIRSESKPSVVKNKLTAKAVAHELEIEAQQIKNAGKIMKDLEIYNTEKELLKETSALQAVQKQIDSLKEEQKKVQATKELKKEAREILKVQKQIDDIKKIQELEKEAKVMKKAEKQVNNVKKQIDEIKKIQELEKEAKALKKAEKQIKEIKFLDQQEKIVKQAKSIADAQKEIDKMNKDTKKSMIKPVPSKASKTDVIKVKTIKVKDDSFYFATENGNKFHEPGCLAIKKVPKNKLTLYTNKKEAMKKGLQPCNVCIPK